MDNVRRTERASLSVMVWSLRISATSFVRRQKNSARIPRIRCLVGLLRGSFAPPGRVLDPETMLSLLTGGELAQDSTACRLMLCRTSENLRLPVVAVARSAADNPIAPP